MLNEHADCYKKFKKKKQNKTVDLLNLMILFLTSIEVCIWSTAVQMGVWQPILILTKYYILFLKVLEILVLREKTFKI